MSRPPYLPESDYDMYERAAEERDRYMTVLDEVVRPLLNAIREERPNSTLAQWAALVDQRISEAHVENGTIVPRE